MTRIMGTTYETQYLVGFLPSNFEKVNKYYTRFRCDGKYANNLSLLCIDLF